MKRTNPRLASIETLVKLARKGADGRDWYSQAADQIRQAARHIGCSPYELASVLAVTSPRVSVRRNIRFAVAWLRDGVVSRFIITNETAQGRLFENETCKLPNGSVPF